MHASQTTTTMSSASAEQQLLLNWIESISTTTFKNEKITLDDLIEAREFACHNSLQRLIQAFFREDLIAHELYHFDAENHCWLVLSDTKRLCFAGSRIGRMHSWRIAGDIVLFEAQQAPRKITLPSELLALMRPLMRFPLSSDGLEKLATELDDSLTNDVLCVAYHRHWNTRFTTLANEQADAEHANNSTSRQARRHADLRPTGAPVQSNGLLSRLRQGKEGENATSLLEQWGAIGHPWHPHYKTKMGLSASQVIGFSPEFKARFPVILCALHRRHAHIESLDTNASAPEDYISWWRHYFPEAAVALEATLRARGLVPQDYLPLPCHPWQAKQALPDKLAQAIADQRLIVTDITAFVGHPTMSFRTVAPNGCPRAPMVKLSVALQLTSIQRTLPPRAACMAPRISRMLCGILAQEAALSRTMTIIPARYGLHMTMDPADDNLCQQAAVLYRDNPMTFLRPGEMAIPVGSLFALDADNQPLLRQWMRLIEGGDTKANALAFFQCYLAIAVPALLGLYLLYGIALEAHQQNSFIVMGKDGQPERLLIQDFDGIDIDRAALEERGFTVKQFGAYPAPFKAGDDVRVQLLHASFMCHIGELALLCAREWDMPDRLFWDAFHTEVVQCFDTMRPRMAASRWSTERHAILEAEWPARSLLRMKLSEPPQEIICLLSNPLRGAPTLAASLRQVT